MDEEFDALQYIASYSDLIVAFGDNATAGEQHYLRSGRSERRQTDLFDEEQYLANNPDLQRAFGADGELATIHYLRFGFYEGRNDDPPLPANFDALQYLASHDDLIEAFGANTQLAQLHYLKHGRAEGRAIDTFDEQQYLANYSDLALALGGNGGAATFHYILFGKAEGRSDAEEGNTPPTAVDDTLAITEDDGRTIVDVLGNDSDLDLGDVLTVAAVSNVGAKGSLSLGPGGIVFYDPGDAFIGLGDGEEDADSFNYTVSDGKGGESQATVTVKITGINDAPVITNPAEAATPENTTTTGLTLAAEDPEVQPIAFTIAGGADAALFSIDAANQLVFAAAPDFESPTDSDADNVYLVRVTADDGAGGLTAQDLAITVTDVDFLLA